MDHSSLGFPAGSALTNRMSARSGYQPAQRRSCNTTVHSPHTYSNVGGFFRRVRFALACRTVRCAARRAAAKARARRPVTDSRRVRGSLGSYGTSAGPAFPRAPRPELTNSLSKSCLRNSRFNPRASGSEPCQAYNYRVTGIHKSTKQH